MIQNQKCAVFSCLGLGDGLIANILSNNLSQNGNQVVTYHPSLSQLQDWFPYFQIAAFPQLEKLQEALRAFNRFFIFFEKSPWMQEVLKLCQQYYPDKTHILNPIATPNTDYPYWKEGRFDGRLTFAENLYLYCKDVLKLPSVTKGNGITPLPHIKVKKHPSRVVIHPMSSRPGKNWSSKKFLELSDELREQNYEPVFILSPQEREEWEVDAPLFPSFSELAAFVAESGYMIGNDSGIGHLASCLGLPSITICRSKTTANFWRPGWTKGNVVLPPSYIPNIKGMRLRDKYWKKWVSVNKVLSSFNRLKE